MTVIAHSGHWAVQLLYLAPLVVLIWVLVSTRLKERRERDSEGQSVGLKTSESLQAPDDRLE